MRALQQRDTFGWVHVGALSLTAIALPWSTFLISLSQIILAGNWLLEGAVKRDLGRRVRQAFTSAPALVFIAFFLLHVLGLLWTTDLAWGLDLCRILAPVFIFGVILSGSPRLAADDLRYILWLFVASVIVSTFACLIGRPEGEGSHDFRSLSVFVSHIRLALLLCMSAAVIAIHRPFGSRILQLAAIAWTIFFLNELESLSGILILGALALWALWRFGGTIQGPRRWLVRLLVLIVPLGAAGYLWWCVRDFRHTEPLDLARLEERSAGGETYYHDRVRPGRENGHYVWVYVADGELERGWALRSDLPYAGNDRHGQPLRWTLVRYMASLGLRKDSIGVSGLSDTDVHRIEQGVTSVTEGRRTALRSRIDEVLFELDHYRTTGDPSGHSFTMRLEFWKAGAAIARAHWLAGVGTGDTQIAFNAEYERIQSRLGERWRLRAHNEYLTLFISFGLFGGLIALLTWCWPAWRTKAWRSSLFMAWAVIFAVSCLTDDTVETQVGATFFAYFYCLFVFAAPAVTQGPREA